MPPSAARAALATATGAAVVTAMLMAPAQGAGVRTADSAAGRYIVVLKDGASAGRGADRARDMGAEIDHVYRSALKGFAGNMSRTVAARLADDPRVAWVQRDYVAHATAQSVPTGINRVDAELSPTAAIDGIDQRVNVDVAVVDTGVDLDHPDLNVYTAGAKNCSTGRSADDGNGHGTHVAGTIGAIDNAVGVVGVAPGARVWPVRVLDNRGSGTWSAIICGIDYVTANADRIEVANMSLGGSGSDDRNCGRTNNDAMHTAICNSVAAGITYVVAAGNDSDNAANHVPAAYDEVITVTALADFNGLPGGGAAATCRSDVDDTFANFSNYGADVDIIAPGVCINSTWKGGAYKTISGTSMASPHVAGGAALYLATHPGTSPSAVKSALQAAGSTDWSNADDSDGVKEPLLNVAGF